MGFSTSSAENNEWHYRMLPFQRRNHVFNLWNTTSLCILALSWMAPLATAATSSDWVTNCRRDGFDPDRLACSTCQQLGELVENQQQKRCTECCQAWLDTPRMTRPFQAAVLIERSSYGTQHSDELSNFLKEDWDEVVRELKSSSGNRLLHHIVDTQAIGASSSYFSLGRQRLPPSQLLFFDDAATAVDPKQKDVAKLQAAAQDTFDLSGLKREDIKDMILTLLPNTKTKSG